MGKRYDQLDLDNRIEFSRIKCPTWTPTSGSLTSNVKRRENHQIAIGCTGSQTPGRRPWRLEMNERKSGSQEKTKDIGRQQHGALRGPDICDRGRHPVPGGPGLADHDALFRGEPVHLGRNTVHHPDILGRRILSGRPHFPAVRGRGPRNSIPGCPGGFRAVDRACHCALSHSVPTVIQRGPDPR